MNEIGLKYSSGFRKNSERRRNMNKNQPVDIYGKPYNRTLLVVVLLIGTFCTVLNQIVQTV